MFGRMRERRVKTANMGVEIWASRFIPVDPLTRLCLLSEGKMVFTLEERINQNHGERKYKQHGRLIHQKQLRLRNQCFQRGSSFFFFFF